MILASILGIVSALSFLGCLLLGTAVSVFPQNPADRNIVKALRGHATPVALFFTWTGRSLPLAVLGTVAVAIVFFSHGSIWLPIAVLASQIASQGAVELLKIVFRRQRPDVFFGGRELGLSYPSGHATTAVVFYGAWTLLLAHSSLPGAAKAVCVGVLAAWLAAIGLSRLALGAHYVSDVIGGTLFGIAWIAAVVALGLHTGLLSA